MYQHGGDIYKQEVKLDFSINVNPLGMPEEVVQAACEGVRESGKYPDYACRKLREALAKQKGFKEEHLLFGNGAAELIFLLCQAVRPKRALLLAPTFSEYEEALHAVDCEIDNFHLEKETGFSVTADIMKQLELGYDLVFLCNPNNPTGETILPALLEEIAECCEKKKTILVVDECFQEFLEEEEQYSLAMQVLKYENLCILKAFTKIYCMAGLRLGYLVTSNEQILSRIPKLSQPWRVSIPAQYAGIAALGAEEYISRTKEVIRQERNYLKEALTQAGYICYASKANYIFFQAEEGLKEALLAKGILIRSCENYRGLDGTFYRIGIRLHEQNRELIQAIRSVREENLEN